MTITLTVFANSPDRGRGLARDMRVRWALEELGLSYDIRPLTMAQIKDAPYLAEQPFGQIPFFDDGQVRLFESGAIVLYSAQQQGGLLPHAARDMVWIFAALNTVEPPILEWANARLLEGEAPWAAARLPVVVARLQRVLGQLAQHLGDKTWLEGAFSAGDLMMVSVLARLTSSGLLDQYPPLADYVARGQNRPAYLRAWNAQAALFHAKNPRQTS